MITRYLSMGLGALVLVLMATGLWYRAEAATANAKVDVLGQREQVMTQTLVKQKSAYDELQSTYTKAQDAIKERDLKIEALTKIKALQDAKLKQALKANQAWSDSIVPIDVMSALRMQLGTPSTAPKR